MRQLCLALCLIAAPLSPPLSAQEASPDTEEGFDLIERGVQSLLRGFLQEAQPALEDLRSLLHEAEPELRAFLDQMGPRLAEILDQVDDLTNYGPPVILPNGDILIPRKSEAPVFAPEDPIEL